MGKETLTVEAGVYEAYKVVAKGKNLAEQLEMTYWLRPDFGRAIKTIFRLSRGAYWSWEWAKHPREKS